MSSQYLREGLQGRNFLKLLLVDRVYDEISDEIEEAMPLKPAMSIQEAAASGNYSYGPPFFTRPSFDSNEVNPDTIVDLWYSADVDLNELDFSDHVESGIRIAQAEGGYAFLVPGLQFKPQRVKNNGDYYELTDSAKEEIPTFENLWMCFIQTDGENRLKALFEDGHRFKHYHSLSNYDCMGEGVLSGHDFELQEVNPMDVDALFELKERWSTSFHVINRDSLGSHGDELPSSSYLETEDEPADTGIL